MKHLTHHQFSASVDGVLQGFPARLMESHLSVCPACRARWDGFVATQEAIADLMRHEATPEFRATLVEALERDATQGDDETEPASPVATVVDVAPPRAPASEPPPAVDLVPAIAGVHEPRGGSQVPAAPATASKTGTGRHMTHHQLSAWLDGELIGVSAQLVERHLAVCDACRTRWEGFRDARAALVDLLRHDAGRGFAGDLERVLDEIATKGVAPAWLESGPARAVTAGPAAPAPAVTPAPAPLRDRAHVPPPVVEPRPAASPDPVRVIIEPAPSGRHEPVRPTPAVGPPKPPRRETPPPARSDRPPARPEAGPPPVPAMSAPPRRAVRDRRPRDRGDETALSRVWMITAVCVLAAVVWVSWMLWDYHRSGTLRSATVAAIPESGESARRQPARVAPLPRAEAVVPPVRVPEPPAAVKDSVVVKPVEPPAAIVAAAPVVSAPIATVTAPEPKPAPPPVVATARPTPVRPPPPEPRRAPAQTTPAAPPAASAPKQASAVPVLGLLCGRVSDENNQPVVGARVLLADLQVPVATDRNGGFCVSAPLGERTVSIVALGFETSRQVVLVGRETLEILVTLRSTAPAPPARDPR